MQTKLTLRMDSGVIFQAKAEAAARGKSLSQLVADFIMGLRNRKRPAPEAIPPLVASMRGLLKGKLRQPDKAWRRHLEEKYR